jgi:hypothetical protein
MRKFRTQLRCHTHPQLSKPILRASPIFPSGYGLFNFGDVLAGLQGFAVLLDELCQAAESCKRWQTAVNSWGAISVRIPSAGELP